MVAVGNNKNFSESPEILGIKKSSNSLDDLFAELFSLVNMDSLEDKNIQKNQNPILLEDKNLGKNLENIGVNLENIGVNLENIGENIGEKKNNSFELTKSLAEIFYKEIGIVDTDENEKVILEEVDQKNNFFNPSSNHQEIKGNNLKLELNNTGIKMANLEFGENSSGKDFLKNKPQENKLIFKSKNPKNSTDDYMNLKKNNLEKDHKIKIKIKNIKKNPQNKVKNINQMNLVIEKRLAKESPKKVIGTGNIDEASTASAKNAMVEKKILKKNKQVHKKIENFGNEKPKKINNPLIIKNNFTTKTSNIKNPTKDLSESLRNLTTDKNGSKISKNNFSSQSSFDTQNTLDLMESSWGEKFAKIIKNSLNNQVKRINFKLNPKNLGKLSVEISVKGGSTQIQFNAENQEAANLLNENLGKISELIEDKDSKFNNQSGNNGEKFSQQQERKKEENFNKSIVGKKVSSNKQSQNKNNHNIDVQA